MPLREWPRSWPVRMCPPTLSPRAPSRLPARAGDAIIRHGPATLLAASSWAAVLLVINRKIFSLRLIETGDLATILYQVRDAQGFHELLGNYSRWLFHHPGPAFMYVLAGGDAIFRRTLHLVPEPANAAFLTVLLLNVALLFLAIRIFARHCRSNVFLPAAVGCSLLLTYVINRTLGPVATANVWLPHMILFVFLLFLTTCVSVGSGTVKDLPLLVFCGGLLVHGHVAQVLFVAVLSLAALIALYLTCIRQTGVRSFFSSHRGTVTVAIALVVLFLTPILLDRVIDHPNNIHKIRAYLREHRGEQKSAREALRYELSFFTLTPDPETAVPTSSVASLISGATKKPYVVACWIVVFGLAFTAIFARRKATQPIAGFLMGVAFEVLVVCLLFFYWATRITGPFYNFNGFFFYSVELLLMFALVSVVLNSLPVTMNFAFSTALACAFPLLMFASPTTFRVVGTSRAAHPSPELQRFAYEIEKIEGSIPHGSSQVRIRFPNENENWALAMGVASRLHWANQPICVSENAAIWLEDRDVCRQVENLRDLSLSPAPTACVPPCQLLTHDDAWSAQMRPFPAESLPFTIGPSGDNSLNLNFYDPETPNGPQWTKNSSRLLFLLSRDWSQTSQVLVRIDAIAAEGRVVQVLLNGENIGKVVGDGRVAPEFPVSADLFRPSHQNELLFQANGPVGVKLIAVSFRAKDQLANDGR